MARSKVVEQLVVSINTIHLPDVEISEEVKNEVLADGITQSVVVDNDNVVFGIERLRAVIELLKEGKYNKTQVPAIFYRPDASPITGYINLAV